MAALSTSVRMDDIPGRLPGSVIPQDADLAPLPAIVEQYLANLSPSCLTDDALWRDWFSMTGGVRTFSSGTLIAELWTKLSSEHGAKKFQAVGSPVITRCGTESSWAVVSFVYNINPGGLAANASGTASLVQLEDGSWKIWTLTSVLESFEGQRHPDTCEEMALNGTTTDKVPNANGTNGINHTNNINQSQSFEVVIIGSGQHGLGLAGRLQALGIPYVVFERNAEVGDTWLNRYDSVKLHTIKDLNHLPFAPTWDKEEPCYLPAKIVADGHRRFVQRYNINVQTSTNVENCSWDEDSRTWKVQATRGGSNLTFSAKQIALATGGGYGMPLWPQWSGKENFEGILMHSSTYKNCKAWEGKKAIIIGTGTSAHDMAFDMAKAGIPVTMVQRGRTPVFPREWTEDAMEIFNPHIPIEIADRIGSAVPIKVMREMGKVNMDALKLAEHERFDALERAGFKVDREAQLWDLIFEKLGGYYMDVGASALIANGTIGIKSGVEVSHYTPSGLAFDDGTELEADIICVATGFEVNYDHYLTELFGKTLAAKVGNFWGLDAEGELRGLLKHVGGVPLWLLGGGATQARWNSRFMALHIQAASLGKPLKRFEV